MDETASTIIDRETALADFDHARDDFEDALSEVPDGALSYKPEGDDYSIGEIVTHVTSSMRMYTAVLDMMRDLEFQEVRLAGYPGGNATIEEEPDADASTQQPGDDASGISRGKQAALDAMEATHNMLAARLGELAHEDYSRPSSVYYPGSEEGYPTRASDIISWMTDHYRNHAKQVREMLLKRDE